MAGQEKGAVGDRYGRDIVGGNAAGLFTVLLDVHAHPIPPAGPRPDAVVSAIGDVLAALPLATVTLSLSKRDGLR